MSISNTTCNATYNATCNTTWRLIPCLEAPGQVQMAIDQWLFQQHCLGLQPPILRFYTWSPIAISLGYHQSRFPEAWKNLQWQQQPIDLVRRPSGGRAVLHQGDLTYAVIASGFSPNRAAAYQEICQFLIEGWRSLSRPLHYGQSQRNYLHNPNCFGTATGADLITPNGSKLIGSAQLRRGSAILQHGSICLTPDRALFQMVFGETPEGFDFPISQVMKALTQAAQHCFKMQITIQPLSPAEWHEINALAFTLCHSQLR